jgi:hypothetical protein
VPSSYDPALMPLGAADARSERLRLQQLRPINDLQAGAHDAWWLIESQEITRGDAAANIQVMSGASGLVDTYGDDILSAWMAAGFAEPKLEAKQSTAVLSDGISTEKLEAKAVANDVTRPADQQLIIRRVSEIASEPITYQAPRRGWPRKVHAAEGVTS